MRELAYKTETTAESADKQLSCNKWQATTNFQNKISQSPRLGNGWLALETRSTAFAKTAGQLRAGRPENGQLFFMATHLNGTILRAAAKWRLKGGRELKILKTLGGKKIQKRLRIEPEIHTDGDKKQAMKNFWKMQRNTPNTCQLRVLESEEGFCLQWSTSGRK